MSFAIAVSGLNACTQDMNAISNNIANVNTVGYYGYSATFASAYVAGQPNGVMSTGFVQNFDAAGMASFTGRSLDVSIAGGGYFITQNQSGEVVYSRAGQFTMDKNGYLIDSNGNMVMGYPVDENGNVISGQLEPIQVSSGGMNAKPTTAVDLGMNLDQSEVPIDRTTTPLDPTDPNTYHSTNSTVVYDSYGNQHTMTQYYTQVPPIAPSTEATWEVQVSMDGGTPAPMTNLVFDSSGNLVSGGTFTVNYQPPGGAAPMVIDVDLTQTTQYAAPFSNTLNSADGYAAGEMTGLTIDSNGNVSATYTNGQKMLQGQIVLATFPNPNGLQVENGTAWSETSESGQPLYGTPGSGMCGTLNSGYLQASNVDINLELVNLVEAQRNYQANTKVISTEVAMNAALMNAI